MVGAKPMTIQLSPSVPFNLDTTLCCGQVFKWDKHDEWWYGAAGERLFKIRQNGDKVEFENVDTDFVMDYFGLTDDLPKIFSQISKDNYIQTAINEFKGLRILRQDPWECLISYICATYKSIAAIKRMLHNLSRMFGDRIRLDDHEFYTFPAPQKLAQASMHQLAECGLGYRARYVCETARMVNQGIIDFEQLKKMAYETAKAELLCLPGVGMKVADCILLFSLGKLEAFPIDVWIRRTILRHYREHFPREFIKRIKDKQSLTKSEYERLSTFGRGHFGRYAGYAQEYLYHYERTLK
jgi:N-glycosylase/DNA lyase